MFLLTDRTSVNPQAHTLGYIVRGEQAVFSFRPRAKMQLSLFPSEAFAQNAAPPKPVDQGPSDQPPENLCPDDLFRQIPLFSAWTALIGTLEQAVAQADFPVAKSVCSEIEATYGPADIPPWAESIKQIPNDIWERKDIQKLLDTGHQIETQLPTTSQQRCFRHAFSRKLFAIHPPELVIAKVETSLPQVAGTLAEWGDTSRARLLVRDLLLSGKEVPSIPEDPPLADLLSEDLSPRWLAALGAIRRLWPLPLPDTSERTAISAMLSEPYPEDEMLRAQVFWDLLRLAELRSDLPEPVLHAARRSLKRLHPELHAAYLNHSGQFS